MRINPFKSVTCVALLLTTSFGCDQAKNDTNDTIEEPVREIMDHNFRNKFLSSTDSSSIYLNPDSSIESRIADLMSRMSLEEKCAQMVQGERKHVTPEDLEKYGLGSLLSGGGSLPVDNKVNDWNSID